MNAKADRSRRVSAANSTQVDLYAHVTEASALGLKPGEWPESLDTTLGNGRPFVRGEQLHAGRHDEYFGGYLYKQELGVLRLQVFND